MIREAAIEGEGFRLVLSVGGYERPSLESGADANWLMGKAELVAKGHGASFQGSVSVSLRTEELQSFRDQLAVLVEHLDGEATLLHMEEQVGGTVSLRRGRGDFTGFVRHYDGAELRVQEMPTDQSYLQQSLREFDALVGAFPVKGDPLG